MKQSSGSSKLLWQPTDAFLKQSNLAHYRQWLADQTQLQFENYDDLWQWSVDEPSAFWESLWQYFGIISHSPYRAVMSTDAMPNTRWFEGSTLNYAEHVFRQAQSGQPAILFQSERQGPTEISWAQLTTQVAAFQAFLQSKGIGKGDRVVAFIPNIPEATVAFLATISLGAIWSSCSPDFGSNSVVDRFQQIEPKVLIAVDGYQYNGKPYHKADVVQEIIEKIPSLETVVYLPYLEEEGSESEIPSAVLWSEALRTPHDGQPRFVAVPFDHPIWVLYSSGTTGIPKAITHSHGGVLLEHLKYLSFHNDVHPGERFFWFSTTGWMMWNFVQAALLKGATIVLYDGSPGYPDLGMLWRLIEEAGIHHFGTSAPFLVACMKKQLEPGQEYNLSTLRSIGSTGSPLPPEAFDWVYAKVKSEVWLCSMSGGTDVCTAFVGGCPEKPLYEGEIQCRTLGCSLYAFDEKGEAVVGEVGEMVITQAMPSMPIYFWNDPGKARYLASYFEMYPGAIWRHGDWVQITPQGSLVIMGRSDATLNRHGVRIGTSEIYRALNLIPELEDCLIVNLELEGGNHYMPLFAKLNSGIQLDDHLKQKINTTLRSEYTPRHVPDEIVEVAEIPYTISGKKLEAPVKKILLGIPVSKAANRDSMKNPESLTFFVQFAQQLQTGEKK